MESAKGLTNQFLTFATGGSPVKKAVTIEEIIKDTTEFHLLGSNVQPHFTIPDNLWPVNADKDQLSQVISNLVLNARQAMIDGGDLYISIENKEIPEIPPTLLPAGKYVKITIKDTGSGIPFDHKDKIFDPYFSTKKNGQGLGLSIVHSIVEKHHGKVNVISEPKNGTSFKIYLPTTVVQQTNLAAPGPQEELDTPFPCKILLMDDEKMVLEVTKGLLEVVGCTVSLAMDGNQAIEIFKEANDNGEPYDAVIMDLTIPGGMGGKEAVKEILSIDPDAKTIVSSGYSSDPVMAKYGDFGFKGVLSKPFTFPELEQTIKNVLGGTN